MKSISLDRSWISVHLFFPSDIYGPWADVIVLDFIEPFARLCEANGWIERWFFVRYNEHGPHVRVRLFGEQTTLNEKVRPALERALRRRDPNVLEGLSDNTDEWTQLCDGERERSAIRRFAWIAYVRETQRYGGPRGVELAEDLFHHSSELALACLRAFGHSDRPGHLGRALLAMLTTTHVFFETRVAATRFAGMFASGYVRSVAGDESASSRLSSAFDHGFGRQAATLPAFIEDVWERLDAGEALTDDLDTFHNRIATVRDQFAASCAEGLLTVREGAAPFDEVAIQIVPSHVHMMNNRLGISIIEETYLAHLIYRTLTSKVGKVRADGEE